MVTLDPRLRRRWEETTRPDARPGDTPEQTAARAPIVEASSTGLITRIKERLEDIEH